MERQLPKNVRQIGNVCDEPKIYVEDYVDTFLGQLQEKAMEKPVAAALTGEITKCEDKVVVYISGAIRAEDVEVEGTNLKISEEIWEKIEKEQKEYFKDQKLIGWCLLETGHPMSMNRGAQELHRKIYDQENTIFIWKDASSSDEMYFAYKYNELMQIGGHYIYYEKNPQMQNYMINTRRQNGVTPSEMVEDRATKDFRSAVRQRMEIKEQSQSSKLLYATSALLVVVVLAIGVSMMNNFERMDRPGCITEVSAALSREKINVATMQVFRHKRGGLAVMVVETDQSIPENVVAELKMKEDILEVISLNLEEGR